MYKWTSDPNEHKNWRRRWSFSMATLGTIVPFSPTIEDWNAFIDRFEQYVIANKIEDKKKVVATFLTTNWSKSCNILRDLLAPAKPSKLKLEVLVETLRNHYESKPIVIAKRLYFHKRKQHEGEGVAAYNWNSWSISQQFQECAHRGRDILCETTAGTEGTKRQNEAVFSMWWWPYATKVQIQRPELLALQRKGTYS